MRKIVIVEDNEQMLGFMKTTLGGAYEVYTAADGQQGLEEIRRVYPDLIICPAWTVSKCARSSGRTP